MVHDPSLFSPESWADARPGLVLEAGALVAGKYRLVRPAGFGGMGAVWVARNESTNADVAIKVLLADPAKVDKEAALRFRREAHAAAQLYHRGIVRIFDLVELTGADEGTLVMVMELLRGETLASLLDRRRVFPLDEALGIILPLLSALAHAHAAGIVHRDLKPENVFLSVDPDGHIIPKILDFGIARLNSPQAPKITTDGAMLGTPNYMSPEQARGSPNVDARSDVFAVGIILYEMLSGSSPFASGSYHSVIAAILERDPAPLANVPTEIWKVIRRALDKVQEIRFADASELALALKGAAERAGTPSPDLSGGFARAPSMVDGSVPPAPARDPQPTVPSVYVKSKRRTHLLAALAVVGVVFALAGAAVAVRVGQSGRGAAASAPASSSAIVPAAATPAVVAPPALSAPAPVASPSAALTATASSPPLVRGITPGHVAPREPSHVHTRPPPKPAETATAAPAPAATPAPHPTSVVRDPGF